MVYLLKMVIFHGLPIKNGDFPWFTYYPWWFSMVYLLKIVIFHGLPIKHGGFPWFTH